MELREQNAVVREEYRNGKLTKTEILKYIGEKDGFYRFQTMNKKMDEFVNVKPKIFPVAVWKTDENMELKVKYIVL